MAIKKTKKIIKKRLGLQKKTVKKRPRRLKKKPGIAKQKIVKPKENVVGVVTHYFPRVKAAAIKLKAPLSLGESVRIKGHTTDFTQVVTSLQINRVPITKAKRGQEIGLLVDSRVRRKDVVYKV